MSKVRVSEGSETGEFPIGGYADVRIVFRDGSEHALRVDTPRGDPSRPLSWDELATKFRGCAETVVSVEVGERVIDLVQRLDKLTDVRELTGALSVETTEARR